MIKIHPPVTSCFVSEGSVVIYSKPVILFKTALMHRTHSSCSEIRRIFTVLGLIKFRIGPKCLLRYDVLKIDSRISRLSYEAGDKSSSKHRCYLLQLFLLQTLHLLMTSFKTWMSGWGIIFIISLHALLWVD